MIRAVCFDLDGTLLRDDHVDGIVRLVAEELARRHGLDPAALAAANEEAWWDYWPEVGDAWLQGRIPGDDVPLEVWRRALAAVGVTDPAVAVAAVALHTEHERKTFALYDESLEVLSALRERGIRLGVVTNGPSGLQRVKLRVVGLEEHVDAVVISGEHGVHKPDPAIFALALEALGIPAGEALFVGVNPIADVAGARGAGLTSVWIDRTGAEQTCEPHAVVTDLRGLLDLVGHVD